VWRDSHLWHDSFICVTWRVHMLNTGCDRRVGSLQILSHASWPIHTWHDSFASDMPHSCFYDVTRVCVMTRSYVSWLVHVCHDSFICVTWRIHMLNTGCVKRVKSSWRIVSYISNDSFIHDMTHLYQTCLTRMCDVTRTCDMTRSYVWHDVPTRWV